MGGYGALAHALGHPESYQAVGAFSPATVWKGDLEERIGHKMPEMMDLYELLERNCAEGKELPDIFYCIGGQDFLIETADAFQQYMEKLNVKHRFDRIDGYEHDWRFWDVELPEFLDWLPRTDVYSKMGVHKM